MSTTLPPIAWFRDPGLTELTPLTVTPDGHVYGHIAGWGTPHQSFPGRNITPPRSRTDYALFHTGALQVDDDGQAREISVGHLSIGSGHADTHLDHRATAEFYDNAASIAADVCVGEDAHGIWFSGALAPDLDELRARRFRSCALSGDWRAVNGNLELTAVLSVVTPGFPIPRARVASGAPMALVAAGALAPPAAFGKAVDPAWQIRQARRAGAQAGKVFTAAAERAAAAVSQIVITPDGDITFVADTAGGEGVGNGSSGGKGDDLTVEQAALLDAIDDTPALVAALLDEVDETPQRVAALLAELDDEDDVSEEDLQALADLAADDGLDEEAFLSRMPPQLQRSYLTGKVAARIRWNTPGDMTRCMAQAKVHGMGRMAPGACARLHKIATGVWPGDRRNIG